MISSSDGRACRLTICMKPKPLDRGVRNWRPYADQKPQPVRAARSPWLQGRQSTPILLDMSKRKQRPGDLLSRPRFAQLKWWQRPIASIQCHRRGKRGPTGSAPKSIRPVSAARSLHAIMLGENIFVMRVDPVWTEVRLPAKFRPASGGLRTEGCRCPAGRALRAWACPPCSIIAARTISYRTIESSSSLAAAAKAPPARPAESRFPDFACDHLPGEFRVDDRARLWPAIDALDRILRKHINLRRNARSHRSRLRTQPAIGKISQEG